MFDFIFEMAFRDAVMRNAFRNPFKNDKTKMDKEAEKKAESKFAKLKDEIRSVTKPPLKEYINALTQQGDVATADALCYIKKVWSSVRENELYGKYGDNLKGFTFGNAQKLVNMMAKYMLISCYDKPELMKNFKDCHCPMDSIMIEVVFKKIKSGESTIKIEDLKTLSESTAWSALDYIDGNVPKEYCEFQEIIGQLAELEEISRLEYDYIYWG